MLTKLRKLGGDLSAADGLLDLHNQTVFEVRSVAEVTWGYQHPLVDLANQVLPEEEQLPPLYGYFYGEKPPLALASTVYCQTKYLTINCCSLVQKWLDAIFCPNLTGFIT